MQRHLRPDPGVMVEVLLPRREALEGLQGQAPLAPFSRVTLDFVDAASRALLASSQARRFPELVAFGYWMRKSHIGELQQRFEAGCDSALRLPRGLAFHIAPANVDTIFAYSWFVSMLCGNSNVVRVSSRGGEQIDILLELLGDLLERSDFGEIRARVRVLRYAHSESVNRTLSEACAIRVVWGGDATARAMRELPLPPTSIELSFVDKVSLALIDAKGWLAMDTQTRSRQAEHFHADATLFNQQACASPRLVAWVGVADVIARARADFWPRVNASRAGRVPDLSMAGRSDRLFYSQAAAIAAGGRIDSLDGEDFLRIWLEQPDTLDQIPFSGGGVFLECAIAELAELVPILSRRVQTVAVAGFAPEELRLSLARLQPAGIDRVVRFGAALEFQPIWDGFDLFEAFTRRLTVAV